MLKMTDAESKLITDVNMHLMIENGVRGARYEPIYYHAKANNEYVNLNFTKEKEWHIISLDAKLLYAPAMCYKLSFGEHNFRNDISRYTLEHILNLDENGNQCYIFVSDIHYPKTLHDRDYESPILYDQFIPSNDKVKKLMPTFYDNKHYTISFCMLKYCLTKGLKLKKKHHVIYVNQSNFMEPYISLNNEKITECSKNKDEIDVEMFKLMNNSNFGKQIENVRKYKDTRLPNNVAKAKKIATKVTFNF